MLSKQKIIIDYAILLISKGHTLVKLTGTTHTLLSENLAS